MKNKRRFSLVLAVVLAVASILPCYAATTKDKITDAKTRKTSTESTLEDTRNKIAELEAKKEESEVYLEELSSQLTELREGMEQLCKDSDAKALELEEVQKELAEAREQENQRYEDMKVRIQYMYENANTGYMEVLFSSDSFSDFLNSAQNMAEITRYDREMLDDYAAVKKQIEEKEAQILEEQKEIARLQEQSAKKQEQIQELYEATYRQIREWSEDLTGAHTEEGRLLLEIQAQQEQITQLLIRAKAEETKQVQQEADQSTSNPAQSGNSNQQNTNGQGTYLGRFKLTAYCPCSRCCGKWAGRPTASGTMPTAGRTIAMAGLPFGTRLSINGQIYTIEDRGTQYGHIDMFFASHAECLAFGVQYADVYQING